MTRRTRIWLAAAVLFTIVNVAGGVVAAAGGELRHASLHVVLTLVGAYAVVRLAPKLNARAFSRRSESVIPGQQGELTDRLTTLEQSVDAVAVEVERIGEGQRFMTRLFTDHASPRAPEEIIAKPSDISARNANVHREGSGAKAPADRGG